LSNQQDQQTIADILDGDSEKYRLLVERYHKGLIFHLASLLQDQELAEDISQEAFIMAYTKLAQYNSKYSFSTWLYKIADNLAFRALKQIKRTSSLEGVEQIIPDDRITPAERLDLAQNKQAVRSAIRMLEPQYQQVVTLYYWENFSYEQIADVVGCPIGTVRTWLFRAKDQLRKELYGQTR
jgi:RNA polymerase sigma-70 factor (ECF subfamily)